MTSSRTSDLSWPLAATSVRPPRAGHTCSPASCACGELSPEPPPAVPSHAAPAGTTERAGAYRIGDEMPVHLAR